MTTTVTKTVGSGGAPTYDYSSIANWESGEQENLTSLDQIRQAECYDFEDTAQFAIDGWVTDVNRYIRAYTPTSERHTGKPGTGYRLVVAAYAVYQNGNYVHLEGLELCNTATSSAYCIYLNNAAVVYVSSCLVHVSGSGASTGRGICHDGASCTSYTWNTVIYNVAYGIYSSRGGTTIKAYSCTISSSNYCIICQDTGDTSFTTAKNVICQGNTIYTYPMNKGAVDYCASTTYFLHSGTGNRTYQAFSFTDKDNGDYHLTASDTGAKGYGYDTSGESYPFNFNDDIDGVVRSGAWDIGADQYVGSTHLLNAPMPMFFNDGLL